MGRARVAESSLWIAAKTMDSTAFGARDGIALVPARTAVHEVFTKDDRKIEMICKQCGRALTPPEIEDSEWFSPPIYRCRECVERNFNDWLGPALVRYLQRVSSR